MSEDIEPLITEAAQVNEEQPARNDEVETVSLSCSNNTHKACSLALMVICLLLGVVFLVAGKVSTDKDALEINEYPVYRYLAVMLFIGIFMMSALILQKFVRHFFAERRWASHVQPRKQLLPRRLLVGVMFFGLGSSFMTMVEFLEYTTQYDCETKDLSMIFYYLVRTLFTYVQLYFFYRLTSSSEKIIVCSYYQIMHLIAVNLVTWIVTFVDDSEEELHHSSGDHTPNNSTNTTDSLQLFMARRWGVENVTGRCETTAEDLKSTAKMMEPYFYTFTMEYCLLSAGLLLNVWLSLGQSDADHHINTVNDPNTADTESESANIFSASEYVVLNDVDQLHEVGTLWRFGFISGLVYVPIFAGVIFNITFTDTVEQDKLIYVGFQLFFFLSILVASVYGSLQLDKQKEGKIHSEVDFYLLGGALVGVFFLDLFIIIASGCEYTHSPNLAILLIFTNITELLCSITFTHFVYKALHRELPSEKNNKVLKSAAKIREVVSFLFMLNVCFWAMYTYEVKKSAQVLALTERFYTERIWFYISHFVYPLAIFFHFHGAVCMVEVLNIYSKVPVTQAPLAVSHMVPPTLVI